MLAQEEMIAQLEGILQDAEVLKDRCREGILRMSEASDELIALEERARTILPKDSDFGRLFDRRRHESTDWWTTTTSGYVDDKDCDNIDRFVRTVREVLDLYEPEGLREIGRPKDQCDFGASDAYKATKHLFKILKRAKSEVAIVDEYLDDTVFDYVKSLEPTVSVKLLTGIKKPIFSRLLRALQAQGANVEARQNTQCHDRFVALDTQHVWHLGASINGIGKKAFMINRVNDAEELSKFLEDFQQWWAQGQPFSIPTLVVVRYRSQHISCCIPPLMLTTRINQRI